MSRVAVVTDSASDFDPARAAALGIAIVPLLVSFGNDTFSAGLDMSRDEFWAKVKTPGSPIATTAACSPGTFQVAYQKAFDEGADAIVSVHVADTLSGTIKAAQVARKSFADREIHIVDSMSASMGEGMLAELAVEMAAAGSSAADIAATLERRRADLQVYLALETLEYLKRGGRISGARAAIGTMLNVKPIIAVENGIVENAERVRSRPKARERTLELLTQAPLERASILHTTNGDIDEFMAGFMALSKLEPSRVQLMVVGPSVGPHLGPGCVGGVVLLKH